MYDLINRSPSGSISEEEIVNEMYKASLHFYYYFLFCYYMNHHIFLNFFQIIPNDYRKVASYIVKNHLAKLVKDGKVVLINNKWKVKE